MNAQIPAFSGAEGPGATATGGRGGDVYHVTKLDADKDGAIPGSLMYGVKNAPGAGRTIVFDVGGTIYLNGLSANDTMRFNWGNVTIAGQTAPGPGITIAGAGTKWTGTDVILRNIAIRPNRNTNNVSFDAFSLQVKNSIIDHVSATWYTDEGISITDAGASSTVQYAHISEGLTYAGHAYGSIIATEVDGTHYSYNHNLYAHNISRLPAIGSETGVTGAILSFTNNVIYNWQQTKAGYSATDQHSSSNFLGNFYISGPNRGNLTFTGGDDATSVGWTKIFLDKTDPVTANVGDMNRDGDLLDGVAFTKGDGIPGTGNSFYSGSFAVPATAFAVNGAVQPDTAHVALQRVLAYGGANWNNRSPIDARIVDSVSTGAGGLISDISTGTQAGEWTTLMSQRPTGGVAPFTRPVNWDTDNDGMPNAWEEKHGLASNVANNNGDLDNDGYTDIEEYINEIAEWPAPAPIVFSGADSRYAKIQNWLVDTPPLTSLGAQDAFEDFHWQPSKYDTAVINNGTVAVDAVGQHAGNLVLAMNPGDNATVNITSGWLEVEDAEHGLSDGIVSIGDNSAATAALNLSGGMLRTKTLLKGAGGTFNFTGGMLSAEYIGFDLVNNGGVIAPGASPGVMQIDGNLTLNSGALAIEIAGPGAGQFDRVVVRGALMASGVLDVDFLGGYTPAAGATFDILDFATSSGSFTLDLPALGGGLAWNTAQLLTTGVLSVVEQTAPNADFNNDGSVDGQDLLTWQRGLGLAGQTSNANGDADRNGVVEGADVAIWKEQFGTSPASVAHASVPEPASVWIALAMGLTAFSLRRKLAA